MAILGQVGSSEELDILSDLMAKAKIVVMDALDWQVELISLSHLFPHIGCC